MNKKMIIGIIALPVALFLVACVIYFTTEKDKPIDDTYITIKDNASGQEIIDDTEKDKENTSIGKYVPAYAGFDYLLESGMPKFVFDDCRSTIEKFTGEKYGVSPIIGLDKKTYTTTIGAGLDMKYSFEILINNTVRKKITISTDGIQKVTTLIQ